MKKVKTIALFLSILLFIGMLAGCSDVSYIMSVNDTKYPCGPYAFYAQFMRDTYDMQYYYNYQVRLTDILNEEVSEGVKFYEQINETVKEQYLAYIVIDEKFKELGLTLDDETKATIEDTYQTSYVEAYGASAFGEILSKLGLTEDEFKELLSISAKNEAITQYYFGAGGSYEVSDTAMRQYFTQNYARFKYIRMGKTDTEGKELTTDQLIETYGKAKEALAALDEGATIEELIPLYCEDYYTEEEIAAAEASATDSDTDVRASYESYNESLVADGMITDKNGIFNEIIYSYYGYTLDTELVNFVFGAQNGDYSLIELSDAYWIIEKADIQEKESYMEARQSTIFNALTANDLAAMYQEWKGSLPYVFNEAAVKRYDVRGLDEMFTSISSTQG